VGSPLEKSCLLIEPGSFLFSTIVRTVKLNFLSTQFQLSEILVGALLYVRVVKANPGMNPELSCTDASGKAGQYGVLKEGYMFECSTGLSRMLLSSPTCPVLDTLGKKLSFEIAVGLNGRVWVNASSPPTTIIVANALINSEPLSGVQQKIMAEKLLQRVQRALSVRLQQLAKCRNDFQQLDCLIQVTWNLDRMI
ncbi:exosome complex component rrp40-like protein, partial [Trifolium pratense]